MRRLLSGVLASAVAVAVVTAAIELLKPHVPVLSLGVLYVFAVLPIAVVWGLWLAIPVSVASMLAFEWFYLPPVHRFSLANSENWFALAVYLVDGGGRQRARRARAPAGGSRRAARARVGPPRAARDRSARAAASLDDELPAIAGRAAEVLGVEHADIELGPGRRHGRRRGSVPARGRGQNRRRDRTRPPTRTPPRSGASCLRSPRSSPSRSTEAGSSATRSRPRPCAGATS